MWRHPWCFRDRIAIPRTALSFFAARFPLRRPASTLLCAPAGPPGVSGSLRFLRWQRISGPRFASTTFDHQRRRRRMWPIDYWWQTLSTLFVLWIGASLWQILDERNKEFKRQKQQVENGTLTEIELKQDWHLAFLRTLPFRPLSRLWGRLHEIVLPLPLRAPLYQSWTWLFGCDLSEMAAPSLETFPNLQSFFIRALRPDVRPLSPTTLVSPADGRVLHFGPVKENTVEQIKGVSYSLDAFLGTGRHASKSEDVNLKLTQRDEEGHQLWHCVIYLAPGDYHRFHSPAAWIVAKTRHFAGQLFSVSPAVVKLVRGLFVLNERVVMEGSWRHGYFSMTAVGATNVGSIRIDFDQALKTNRFFRVPYGAYTEKMVYGETPSRTSSPILPARPGDRIESEETTPSTPKVSRPSTPARIKTKVSSWFSSKETVEKVEGPQSPGAAGSDRPLGLTPLIVGQDDDLPPLPPQTLSPSGVVGLQLHPGGEVGRFHLGSTIVLIFEAPRDFRFLVRAGDKVKVGEALGECMDVLEESVDTRRSIHATQVKRELRTRKPGSMKTDRRGWWGYLSPRTLLRRRKRRMTEENPLPLKKEELDSGVSDTDDTNGQDEGVWISKAGELVGEWLFSDGDPRHVDDK